MIPHPIQRLIAASFLLLSWNSVCIASEADFRYDPDTGLLNVQINQMPLHAFLEKVVAETGIQAEISTEEQHFVTLRQERIPLERALKSALRGTNHMLLYRSAESGEPVLSGVRVVGRGENVTYAASEQSAVAQSPEPSRQELLEQAKESDPEYQKSLKVSQILQENMRRGQSDGPPPLVVINRPTPPSRALAGSGVPGSAERQAPLPEGQQRERAGK